MTIKKSSSDAFNEADSRKILSEVVECYHNTFKNSLEAISYLIDRGLKSSELIDHFKLGYANNTLVRFIQERNREEGGEIRERLQNIGILHSSGEERFEGSLVIPIIDENHAVQGVYGRKIRDHLLEEAACHLYLPGCCEGVFNVKAFAETGAVILCESLIDALSVWVTGLRNVTCCYGVGGIIENILGALKAYSIKTIYIAYDGDEPGDERAKKHAELLMQEGFSCYRVLFPRGMDANAYLIENGKAALESLIGSAQQMEAQ